ncbi:ERI1 exoribonuclease 3-like isoform X1 [Metopolophium dirhodum]|uniref:ERI1 exoribonuclease 3-like isoform X1 n=1 Tax=Metopolophium dirhodum TaxID=44670 RepID=UPI00298F3FD2|nr:ERI1 exoribonuclease 3-like isoform X1 [Metopolophium dirhodum]
MMKFNVLFRPQIFHKYNLVFNKTMFIRSTDKPNAESITRPNMSQPYTKFFVLDFEATCDNGAHLLKPQEIIEFPCILVELNTAKGGFEVVSIFHSYVKPIIHTVLTEYCTQLTGITQDMVSNSPPFDDVFFNFCNWHKDHTNMGKEKSIIVTSGNWDIGNMFIEQCKLFPSTIKIPEFMCTWINIKKLFALTMGQYPLGIKSMLKTTNSKQFGNIHSGIDDCVNIITIMNQLSQRGCVFQATNKIISV